MRQLACRFNPSGCVYDLSFRKRLDDLVRLSRRIVVIGWEPFCGDDLFNYLLTFAKITLVDQDRANLDAVALPVTKICSDILKFDASNNDCVVWQYGPERLIKDEAVGMIARLKKQVPNGIIETYNNMADDRLELVDCDFARTHHIHQSRWSSTDFAHAGLDWRNYGPGRGETPRLIGYWDDQ